MKKQIFLLALLFLSCSALFAQRTTGNTELTVKNGFFGWQFYRNGEKIALPEVANLMAPNEQAAAYLRSARTNYTWSQVIGSIGGFMVGYPLGASMGGGNPNWTVAGIGAGLIVTSIPFSVKANKQAKNAIVTYNEGTGTTSYRKPSFHYGFTGTGVGVSMHF